MYRAGAHRADLARNPGLNMTGPNHTLPEGYIKVKYREEFSKQLELLLTGLTGVGRMKWAHLFRHQALMRAMDIVDHKSTVKV